jgi:copper homeostasis protein (lipoprotein)
VRDCEGIETSLFLEKDGTWVMNERYQGVSREPSSFASYGTWARTADKLVLTDSKGEKSYYRAKGDKLEMLDRDGNPIESTLNYTLESVKASLPITPMAMRGCTSIWRMPRPLPIAQPASEWRSRITRSSSVIMPRRAERYSPGAAGGRGHFTLEANPDSGAPVKVLAVDSPGKGIKEDCNSR